MSDVIVETKDLQKIYQMGEVQVPVLRGVAMQVTRGAFHAIVGPSGCGKTTLLNLLGALDSPSSGKISVDGTELSSLDEDGRTRYRQQKVGFIFQFFNLMPLLTSLENVELGLEVVAGMSAEKIHARAAEVLKQVGLESEMNKFPSQLSGGQQQRVAIARALAKQPSIVLCDEPTGNLDMKTSQTVVQMMKDLNKTLGTTFIIVTHDPHVAEQASHVTKLLDGQVQAS